mgnify:CR=1 FL=1
MFEVKKIEEYSTRAECNCLCCTGRCQHKATFCHRPRWVTEVWQITLPDGKSIEKSISYYYDYYRNRIIPGVADILCEVLEENGYRVFRYEGEDNSYYYYSTTVIHSITAIKNVFVIDSHGISVTGPWYGPTNSLSTYVKFVVVPPDVEEAEWEVETWRDSNVPHNVSVLCYDEETGEEYVMLEQCFCYKEEYIKERWNFRNGEVYTEVIESRTKCDGLKQDDE